jgi:hypothetical protein
MPILAAVADSDSVDGHLTFLSPQYTADGTFQNGETFADFVHRISGSDNAFATLTGTTVPTYDGADISQQGQNLTVPGDWTDVIKYHGSGSIGTDLPDDGVLITASHGTTYTTYVADPTVDTGLFGPPPKSQIQATVDIASLPTQASSPGSKVSTYSSW